MAGVDKHWVGTSPGAWDATANWSLTRSGAGGAALPTTDDDVFVESGYPPSSNLANITDVLGSLTWSADFPMGTIASPLSVNVNGTSAYAALGWSGLVRITRSGAFANLQAASAAGIKKLSIETPSSCEVRLSVTGTHGFCLASADYVHIGAGASVTIDGVCCNISGTVMRVNGARVTINYSASTMRNLYVAAGSNLSIARSAVNVYVKGGAYAKVLDAAAISGELVVDGGGNCDYLAYGTLNQSEVYPGGRASSALNKYSHSLTTRVKWPNGDNFADSSKLLNAPTNVAIAQESTN